MYRTAETGIWSDPKFRSLSAPAKLLFIYYFTNPHSHFSGLYYLPRILVPHEMDLAPAEVGELRAMLINDDFIKVDDKREVVFVVNMLKYQLPKPNDKQAKGVAAHLATLHNSPLIGCFLDRYATCGIPYAYPRDRVSGVENSSLKEEEEDKDKDKEEDKDQKRKGSRSGDRPAPEVSKPQRAPRKASGDHKAFIDHFARRWREQFGRDYFFQNAKDGAAVGRILTACGGLSEACRIADEYLADRDKFIVSGGHTVAILSNQINRYLARAHVPSSADSDSRFVRAPMTPEIVDIVRKAGGQ